MTRGRASRPLWFGRTAVLFVVLALSAGIVFVPATPGEASPGRPDRNLHPYVGMLVEDLGGGMVDPYCHVTLISSTEAVTAHHCASTGFQVAMTFDNPVVIPAEIHTGTVRTGGWDFDVSEVDVAIIDLDEPIDLPSYAEVPSEVFDHVPGVSLEFVTYIAMKQSALVSQGLFQGRPEDKLLQNEPAHVEFDRNLIRTAPAQGAKSYETETRFNAVLPTCFGNSGSPIFEAGSRVILGVLSSGVGCGGGGDASFFARTDSPLAIGILTGTVTPPPPPPPETSYPLIIQGSGQSGSLSFPATIGAESEYTGSAIGLKGATESIGTVEDGAWEVFPRSLKPEFFAYIVALRDEYTSGEDDLDLYLVWEINGEPTPIFWSGSPTSWEMMMIGPHTLVELAPVVDDLYSFEIWVHGYDTQGASSTFTLFDVELDIDEGNLIVNPTVAGPDSPYVTVDLSWSGLDPAHSFHFGAIKHAVDSVAEPIWKTTFVEIQIPG